MKKFTKLTKKLLLSAIALGLTVVTLSTTTFAWYTSSTTANATGGSAQASGTTSDSTLLISSNGTTFSKSATIAASTADLVPVEYDGSKFKELGSDVASTGYYSFDLYFRTSKTYVSEETVPVYLTGFTLQNSSTSVTPITNILGESNSNPAGCPTAATYSVDIVNALHMAVSVADGDKTFYDLEERVNAQASNQTGFGSNTPDALAYYNAVMGASLTKAELSGETNLALNTKLCEISEANGSSYADVKVTFIIYLAGWDEYCFDVCRGQGFTLAMDFATSIA